MRTSDTLTRPDETPGGPQAQPVLLQFLDIARRRWQLAIGTWLAVMLTAVGVVWSLPRQYESTARFLVKNARQDLVVGPAEGASVMYRDDVAEEIINTELEMLRSRDILSRVVAEMHLDRAHMARGKDPGQAAELAVRDLSRGLVAATIRKTNLIQISYLSPDPSLASAVLKHVSDAYLDAHLVMHSSPGSYELFKQQQETANGELAAAQNELASLARSANIVVPEEQKREVVEALTNSETQYEALRAEIQDAAARVRAAEQKMQQIPRRVQAEVRNVPNQATVDRLTTMLVELKNERTALLTKFTPEDRRVTQLDQQIADTKTALDEVRRSSTDQQSTNVNPTWVELESESLRAQLTLAGLVSKEQQLKQQLEQYRARALQLAEAMPQYEAVARKVARAQANFLLYAKKEEEARIVEALDRQRISNVVLAQAPYVSSIPAKPDVRIGLVVGASLAFAASALAVLLGEHVQLLPVLQRRRRTIGIDDDSSPAAALS